IAIFIGNKLKGTKGSLVATRGSVLPSFLIILLIAMIFSNFKDNPVVIAVFKGIRPAVVALIAVPTVQLAIRSKLNWWRLLLAVVTMALIAFLKVSPIYILLTVAVITAFIAYYQEKRSVR
ncbi:MAG: chromate transporter, partial [Bacteroidales bacterium]|nr:chromate transporter [Bacteroidales bacterium]